MTNKARFTVTIDDELFEKLEDFRFEKRFNTRSQATIALLRLGLESLEQKEKDTKQDGSVSRKRKKVQLPKEQ